MIPLSLTLQNFMSYRTETTVDFSDVTLACLSGNNGAGKSALLDAMTWAIWGKCRASSDRHVISVGETQMEVTFVFRLGQREYRVYRRRTLNGRPTLEFDSRPAEGDEWGSITGDSIRDTERRIADTVKMDYETFITSAFLMQGKADTFTSKSPSERKKILGDILNLGDYDELTQMAREAERAAKSKVEALRSQIDAIEEQLAERPQLQRRLDEVERDLASAGERLAAAYQELEGLVARLQGFEAIARARDNTAERLERNEARLIEVRKRLEDDRAERAELQTLAEREDEIVSGHDRLIRTRAVLQQFNDALQKRQPLERQQSELEAELQREESRVLREIDRLTTQVETTEMQLKDLEMSRLELERLEHEAHEAEPKLALLEARLTEQRELEQSNALLDSENDRLMSEMKTIESRMAALDEGDATCPVCRRPLADGDHEHIRDDWRREGTELGDKYRANQATIKANTARLKDLKAEISTLTEVRDRQLSQTQIIDRLRNDLKQERQLAESHREAAQARDALQNSHRDGTFASQIQGKLVAVKEALDTIPYDLAAHTEAQSSLKQLEPIEAEFRKLEASRVKLEMLIPRITDSENQIALLNDEIKRDRDDIVAYDKQLAEVEDTKSRHAAVRSQITEIEQQRDAAQGERGSIIAQLAGLDRKAEERRELQAEVKRASDDQTAYGELVTAFGRNGIQAIVIETVLPELQEGANELLRRMSTGHLHVEFHSTRQAVSRDSVIETLDIIIRDEHGERPYDLFSGGEAFRVDFAIRVALSKLLARRAGATVDLLVIDEGFGTQDSRGRDGLIEALHSVEPDFASILVITHIDEIRDLFPARLEVTKTPDGSQVTLV